MNRPEAAYRSTRFLIQTARSIQTPHCPLSINSKLWTISLVTVPPWRINRTAVLFQSVIFCFLSFVITRELFESSPENCSRHHPRRCIHHPTMLVYDLLVAIIQEPRVFKLPPSSCLSPSKCSLIYPFYILSLEREAALSSQDMIESRAVSRWGKLRDDQMSNITCSHKSKITFGTPYMYVA